MKGFDCCSLTLQPTTNPVVTPHGWIFDKEAIITFILDKKKEYNKKLKKYEEQLEAEKQEFRDSSHREEEEARARFEATEKNIVTKRVDASRKSPTTTVLATQPLTAKNDTYQHSGCLPWGLRLLFLAEDHFALCRLYIFILYTSSLG